MTGAEAWVAIFGIVCGTAVLITVGIVVGFLVAHRREQEEERRQRDRMEAARAEILRRAGRAS